MLNVNIQNVRVFLRPGPTDLRKSINGLTAAAQEAMRGDPFSGNLFAFCNRRGNLIKIVYWDRNGFCLWLKRLERDRFRWPKTPEDCLEIKPEQLGWLLRGLDFRAAHEELHFSRVV
jgi:transposase